MENQKLIVRCIGGVLLLLVGLVSLGMYGCPKYNVWEQGLKGQAELERAKQNRMIRIQEAEAKLESAKSEAKAEVERAKGVAEANKIIGDSLKDNEAYLKYLWVTGTFNEQSQPTVVYVPTEANLPILEAGRLTPKNDKEGGE